MPHEHTIGDAPIEATRTTVPAMAENALPPIAVEAVHIADKHLADAAPERRKALALDIVMAITRHAETVAIDAIKRVSEHCGKDGRLSPLVAEDETANGDIAPCDDAEFGMTP